jgi:hypothetical protein
METTTESLRRLSLAEVKDAKENGWTCRLELNKLVADPPEGSCENPIVYIASNATGGFRQWYLCEEHAGTIKKKLGHPV